MHPKYHTVAVIQWAVNLRGLQLINSVSETLPGRGHEKTGVAPDLHLVLTVDDLSPYFVRCAGAPISSFVETLFVRNATQSAAGQGRQRQGYDQDKRAKEG